MSFASENIPEKNNIISRGQGRPLGSKNKPKPEPIEDRINSGVAAEELKQIVERIERLVEEKQALSDEIKEIFSEAKGGGFDTKVLRLIIRIRKQDHSERMETEAILELYMNALGMT